MKVFERVIAKYTELLVIVLIALIILLVPEYKERFPAVITAPNGICFVLALVGLIQCRILRKTKKAKVMVPLCVFAIALAILGVCLL